MSPGPGNKICNSTEQSGCSRSSYCVRVRGKAELRCWVTFSPCQALSSTQSCFLGLSPKEAPVWACGTCWGKDSHVFKRMCKQSETAHRTRQCSRRWGKRGVIRDTWMSSVATDECRRVLHALAQYGETEAQRQRVIQGYGQGSHIHGHSAFGGLGKCAGGCSGGAGPPWGPTLG